MSAQKIRETRRSADRFIAALDEERLGDCGDLVRLFTELTGVAPALWRTGMVDFGSYTYPPVRVRIGAGS